MDQPLTCVECGRPIKHHPAGGRWIHSTGGAVAACDLDSDHEPRPAPGADAQSTDEPSDAAAT